MASARSWTVGLQRAITQDMALEVRYVGTRGVNQWSTLNYNERNVIENGFLDEFKLAMANLRANNQAGGGRSGSFAYFGPGTGTNPLPIYLAYLNGRRDADNPGAYTGGAQTWTNTTLASRLVHTNPNPNFVSATTVTASADDPQRQRGRRPRQQPDVPQQRHRGRPAGELLRRQSARRSGERSATAAHSAPITRCRSSCAAGCRTGLSLNGSYQYALEEGSEFLGFHFGRASTSDQRQHPSRDQDAVGLDAFPSAATSASAAT